MQKYESNVFLDPPSTDLRTGEGLGKIEIEFDDFADINWLGNLRIAFGVADVSDCFH